LKAAAADAFAKTSKHLSAELAIVAAEFRLSADAHDEASRKFDAIASTAEDLRAFAGRLSEKSEKLSPLLRSLRGVDAQVTALEEVAAAMATRASELEAKLVALGGSIAPE
jgi:septation ring formation regulator EzrA